MKAIHRNGFIRSLSGDVMRIIIPTASTYFVSGSLAPTAGSGRRYVHIVSSAFIFQCEQIHTLKIWFVKYPLEGRCTLLIKVALVFPIYIAKGAKILTVSLSPHIEAIEEITNAYK